MDRDPLDYLTQLRRKLPRDKLINLINHFSTQGFDRAHVSDDVFGNAYEYLIRNFASKAGKSSGEFYTPREVAYLMAEIVEPQAGHTVCDWASGSGGLLLQCRNFLRRRGGDPDRLFLHAQESNLSTYSTPTVGRRRRLSAVGVRRYSLQASPKRKTM
jgi:type I restriction enzyme M protein